MASSAGLVYIMLLGNNDTVGLEGRIQDLAVGGDS